MVDAEHQQAYDAALKKFSFSTALVNLKLGRRVCRAGWNGKRMWLTLVPGGDNWKDDNTWTLLGCDNITFEGRVDPAPWIGMKTADNNFVPWLCSQTDMLADDWELAN